MSQNEQVLSHLDQRGSLTARGAMADYGIMRLAARIDNLRCNGYRIKTIMHQRGRKRWAEYVLLRGKK